MKFAAVDSSSLASYSLNGVPLPQLHDSALKEWANAQGLPVLAEEHTRMVLCALLAASESSATEGPWRSLREEARGLLVLAVKREGCISATSVAALDLLNKPQIVERYKTYGNRWTINEKSKDLRDRGAAEGRAELTRAREALGDGGSEQLGDWLRSLANVLDEEPVDARPWYLSKPVLVILVITAAFIFAHIVLFVRILHKVHTVDSTALRYPLMGLGASSLVGGIAVGISKLSDIGAPKRS